MGSRSGTETVIAIIHAFLGKRSWSQADLARHLGIGPPALRRRLIEMQGMFPIERFEDPPQVYWSMPKSWLPGGVAFSPDEMADLVRLLARLPRSAVRDRVAQRLVAGQPIGADAALSATISPQASEAEQLYLGQFQEAAANRTVMHMRYFSANRGALEWRHVSPQKVVVGPPDRFVGVCHRTRTLKWFRLDAVVSAQAARDVPFEVCPPEAVDDLLAVSLDGYRDGGDVVRCAFEVRQPEARWVERNLPGKMQVVATATGIRVTVETAAPLRLARFVVGLGEAATVNAGPLATLVRALAQGALAGTTVDT